MRVLLLDPDGDAANRHAKEIGESYSTFSASLRLSVEVLAK